MKVSVCIPVYGVEKYIERCARSLFDQTMKNDIEFIFVDDCTPDRSIEVLEAILSEYPERRSQVKIVRHSHNKGLTGARNTALKEASGEYIIHCDSDDWVDVDLYERMYKTAVETGSDVVCCGIAIEKDSGSILLNLKGTSLEEWFVNGFNSITFNSLCNKMFSGRLALSPDIQAPEHITMAEDLLRTTQMFLSGCSKVAVCPDGYYHYYRGNPGASTTVFSRKAFDSSTEALRILIDRFPEEYASYAEACKGQIIFSALRVTEVSKKEFKSLYDRKTCLKASCNRHLILAKRLILFLSLISFHLARACCRFFECVARKS